MKFTPILTLLCLMTWSFLSFAQTPKIAHVDVESLFTQWPEAEQARKDLQAYELALRSRLQAKVKDFQTKAAAYNKNLATMDAVTRADTETELQNLQTQIQQYEANAQQSITEKNQSLLQPLQNKMRQTIKIVADENNFSHVFSLNASLVYTSYEQGDLSPLVAAKLGFTLSR